MEQYPELAIAIPAKNEAKNIGTLLASLENQDYSKLAETPIVVAVHPDTNDETITIALSHHTALRVSIAKGGYPSEARNAAARASNSRYILFVDADVELPDPKTISKAVELMKQNQLHCVGAYIGCNGSFVDRCMYMGSNMVMYGSQFVSPFGVGMFMLFDRKEFERLGGFDERVLFAEDYLLSKKIHRTKFGIVWVKAYTSNRRFKKMGYLNMARLFIAASVNMDNPAYFYEEHHKNYWR